VKKPESDFFLTGKLKKRIENTRARYRECSSGARQAKMRGAVENTERE
jgi:hypothetical protein